MRNALIVALFALLLAAPTAAIAAGKSITVHKNDGTSVSGELLEQNERGFLVKAEDGLFLIEFDDVKHVEYGGAEPAPQSEVEAQPEPESAPEPAAEPEPAPEPESAAEPESAPEPEDSAPTWAEEPAPDAWIVVRRTDGTTVSGTLVEQTAEAMVVQAGADLVTIPLAEVSRVASGDLGAPGPAGTPQPGPTSTSSVPAPPLPEPDPLATARSAPEYDQYAAERLQLVDRAGYWLGPKQLRYSKRLFGKDDGDPFHVVVNGEPEYRLTFLKFLDLTGHEGLRARYDRALAKATSRSQVGSVLLAVGGGLLVATGVSFGIGASGVDSGTGLAVGTPLLLAGIPHIAVGSAVLATGDVRRKELAGFNLDTLFRRKQAYAGVQQYNGHLRERYDLPDDEALDSPE